MPRAYSEEARRARHEEKVARGARRRVRELCRHSVSGARELRATVRALVECMAALRNGVGSDAATEREFRRTLGKLSKLVGGGAL